MPPALRTLDLSFISPPHLIALIALELDRKAHDADRDFEASDARCPCMGPNTELAMRSQGDSLAKILSKVAVERGYAFRG